MIKSSKTILFHLDLRLAFTIKLLMKKPITTARRQLSVDISTYLEQEITQGRLLPGERIPTESQLTSQFNVSRNVVREAVARLKSEGLVESHQGLGTFVSKTNNRSSFRINNAELLQDRSKLRQLYEMRLDLEVSAAGMAARRRSRQQLAAIQGHFLALRQAAWTDADLVEKSLAFKQAIAEATDNEYFENFVLFLTKNIIEAASLEQRLISSSALKSTLVQEYQAIFDAIRLGDPDLARRAAWQHVINSAQRNGLRGLQGWEITRMTSLGETYAPPCPAPITASRSPSIPLPVDACDCHFHIIGDATNYPFTAHRSYTPPAATLEQYQQLQQQLGLSRGVIVQPSVYGYDNRLVLDTLKQGGDQFRGVVVISEHTSDTELWNMHALGVRGVRINLLYKSGVEVSDVTSLAYKIAPMGWHLQLLVDTSEFADLYETLAYLPVDVVVDHLGHMPTTIGTEHPGFQDLVRLVQENKAWIKLSGAYRFTSMQHSPYEDVTPFAKALIATNPERILWATDWPHVCITTPMPDDSDLLEEFFSWVDHDEQLIEQILVHNPTQLYGF